MLDNTLIDNLKRVDPDRYRAAMFADKADRDALLTLYAFHAELAKVPELVSETMIGQIRYQWWRDALEEIYTDKPVRKHEVATPLAKLIKSHDIPRYWLDKLIDGRERDLDATPFKNLDAARVYCHNTSGALLRVAAYIVDPQSNEDHMLSLGEAWGMIGLARSWKFYQNGMLENVEFEALLEAARQTRRDTIKEMGKARPAVMPAIAYIGLIPKFISRMNTAGYDPEVQMPDYPVFLKKFRLMGGVLTGKV